jgi:cytochrome P450
VTASQELPVLPFEHPGVLGVPAELRRIQDACPITRVRTPAGDEAWLVTRYTEVRQLLADHRLGRAHPEPEQAAKISNAIFFSGPMGNYDTEDVDHARLRELLAPLFSPKRVRALRPRIEQLVDDILDDVVAASPPVDLHEALSVSLPVLVICELLGVPYADRAQFRVWSQTIADLHDPASAHAALAELVDYMLGLVRQRRLEPAEDVISALCTVDGGSVPDDEIAFLAAVLLFAGHETTVVRIDLGVVLLATNPAERDRLAADPSLVPSAVEEILRASTSSGIGTPRYARADIDFGDVTIRAGDAVLLDNGAANHDPREFLRPEQFDVARSHNAHLTFGHGAFYCLGAPLARAELQAVFARLPGRLPTLRLAVPLDEITIRRDLLTGGLEALPVTW